MALRSCTLLAHTGVRIRCRKLLHTKLPLQSEASLASTGEDVAPSTSETTSAAHSIHRLKTINKAMKSYLEKAQQRKEFMQKEIAEFELGKRHLANMMGIDPDTMTQEDIDKAIGYLLPSGLFSPRARPFMRHPDEVFPKDRQVQFGLDGRPFHSLFYTVKPTFYQMMHDIADKQKELEDFADEQHRKGITPPSDKLVLAGSEWITFDNLRTETMELVIPENHTQLIAALEHLMDHPYAYRIKDFFIKWRNPVQGMAVANVDNLSHIQAKGRKSRCYADVTVWTNGSGKFVVDNVSIGELWRTLSREVLLSPFIVLDRLGEFDVQATTNYNAEPVEGEVTRSVAVRTAVAHALTALVTPEDSEKLRLSGLLTPDIRAKERQKPGQKGARAKWIWRKR